MALVSERWTLPAACLVAIASALVGGLLFDELGTGQALLGLAIQLIATAVVAHWRAAVVPAWALAAVTATLAFAPIGWQRAFEAQVTVWVPIMAAYAAARLVGGARRRGDVISGAIALATWLVIMIGSGPPNLLATMGSAAPLLAGLSFALWQRLRDARRDRLAQMAREREMAERERIAAERSQMAADLHDLVTHEIVRVVFQARRLGGGGHGSDVQRAADEIAGTAAEALSQMRDFLRSVREDEDRYAPTEDATAEDAGQNLADLVAEHHAMGQRVRLRRNAEPGLRLTGTVSRCIFRAAQEGLVNAAKHAPDSEVVITWHTRESSHELIVVNALSPQPGDSGLAGTGSGTGLRGIASRERLLGGTMIVGEQDGEFRLQVTIPAGESIATEQNPSPATTARGTAT